MEGQVGGGSCNARGVSALRAMFEAGADKDEGGRQELPAGRPVAPAPEPLELLVRKPDAAAARIQGSVRGLTSTSGARKEIERGADEEVDDTRTSSEPSTERPLLDTEGSAVALGRNPDFKSLNCCGQERPITRSDDGLCGN